MGGQEERARINNRQCHGGYGTQGRGRGRGRERKQGRGRGSGGDVEGEGGGGGGGRGRGRRGRRTDNGIEYAYVLYMRLSLWMVCDACNVHA